MFSKPRRLPVSYMKGAQDICLRGDQLVTKQCTVGDHKIFLRSRAYVCVLFKKNNPNNTNRSIANTVCSVVKNAICGCKTKLTVSPTSLCMLSRIIHIANAKVPICPSTPFARVIVAGFHVSCGQASIFLCFP